MRFAQGVKADEYFVANISIVHFIFHFIFHFYSETWVKHLLNFARVFVFWGCFVRMFIVLLSGHFFSRALGIFFS